MNDVTSRIAAAALDAALAIVKTGRGKAYMDEARGIIRAIRTQQTKRIDDLTYVSNNVTRFTFNVILFGTIAAFLAVSIGGLLIARSITRPIAGAASASSVTRRMST